MTIHSGASIGGAPAVVAMRDVNGKQTKAMAVVLVDGAGALQVDQAYQLATAQVLTAQAGTPAAPTAGSVTAPAGLIMKGSYLWDLQVAGAAPSIILQSLASDGVSWRNVATRTESGTIGVVMGMGAIIRLYNNSANAATVSSSLT